MPVAFRSASLMGVDDVQTGGVVLPEPAGLQINDILLLWVGQFDHFGAGFTSVPPNCTQYAQVEQANTRITAWWKRVITVSDTEEADNDYDFAWASGSTWANGGTLAYSGVKTTGDPIGANFVTGAAVAAAFPTLTLPSVAFAPGLAWMGYHENSATNNDTPDGFTSAITANYGMAAYRIPGTTGVHSSTGATVPSSMNLAQILTALEPASAGTPNSPPPAQRRRMGALMQM